MKNSCPRGSLQCWLDPNSASCILFTVNFNLRAKCHYIQEILEENPLGFRRWQHCREKPIGSLCSVNHEQVFFFPLFFLYCYSKELWDFITFLFSLKMVRCALCAKKRKEASKHFLVPSIPHSEEDSLNSMEVVTWPLTFTGTLPKFRSFGFSILLWTLHRSQGRPCDPLTVSLYTFAEDMKYACTSGLEHPLGGIRCSPPEVLVILNCTLDSA